MEEKGRVYQVERDQPKPSAEEPSEGISITGPLGFWMAMLLIGLLLKFVLAPVVHSAGVTSKDFTTFGNLLLYLPGAIILPLIAGAWIGAKVGNIHRRSPSIGKIGLINAVYAAVIYSIAIFVIYLSIYYISANALPVAFTFGGFALYLLVIPNAILLAVAPSIAMLSSARHQKK